MQRTREQPVPGPAGAHGFATPREVPTGAVVYDREFDGPGVVRAVHGAHVELGRPTGYTWSTHYRRLRKGSAWDRQQLRALARLHRQRQASPTWTPTPSPGKTP
ncbi:hypothetical protein ACIQGZ_10700 [Streptomyces sp. NPDC092296]|uniref:hypothetical protein n=1 Tax=Streptomyces sp. NPDC092296 TaxID=3366012 RepID=UPI0037FC4EBC